MKKISKKLFAFLLTVLLLAATAVVAVPVQAEELTEGVFIYEITDGAITITGCDESAEGTLKIPAAINDVPVTAIATKAFYGNKKITGATIPASVTTIGGGVFGNCLYLTTIDVDEDNTVYCDEDGVLFSKDKKTLIFFPARHTPSGYVIPNGVTTIAEGAFFDSLLSMVEFPNTVTSIGVNAFHFASELTQVSLPSSLTALDYGVFSSCINLTSVTIPDSITVIGKNAFSGCVRLEEVVLPDSVTAIGASAFSNCRSLRSINIPQGVAAIEKNTFYLCENLTKMTLPESVTAIGNRAFFFCDDLKTVEMSKNVTAIGNEAFAGCYSLVSIPLPDSLAVIGEQAFHYCIKLDSVVIPENVTAIGYGAFAECSALTEVAIPSRVSALPAGVFRNCAKLASVALPKSVVSVGYDAFYGCKELQQVRYAGSTGDRTKIIFDDGNKKATTVEWIYGIQEEDPVVQVPTEPVDEGLPPWLITTLYIVALLAAIVFLILLFRTKPSEY